MATLVDPESVRWVEQTPLDNRSYLLIFNARNRMGGYAGPQPQGCWIDAATGRVKSLT